MRAINFKPTRCSHCYRCVRVCQVRAITVKDQQAQIMEDSCILCGDCLNECPQDAKTYVSDLEKVKKWISLDIPVIVSLAPSYHSLFSYKKPGQVFGALKRLGFTAVRETAEGAALVTNEYRKLLEKKTMANIITTCCPSVNLLIETYYPALIPYLACVISPMTAHARLLKQEYGPDIKVVFIGPCISKKAEAYENDPQMDVDAVLNFHEVKQWLRKEQISIKDCETLPLPEQGPGANRLYPITGGILTSINSSGLPERETYRKFSVDGVANCIDLCEDLLTGDLSRCFIEMSACEGGCIQGPMTGKAKLARFRSRVELEEDVEPVPAEDALLHFDTAHFPMSRTFRDLSPKKAMPSEAQIRSILSKIGKFSKEDELDCGACGYPTCREKAVAVFQNKAEASMCIPYITEKAQSLANLILETSPNMTIVVDRELKILEFSKAAQKHFRLNHKEEAAQRANVEELLETVGLSDVRDELATSLPYGKQRRLEIARALAAEPKLLLLDEPAAGMNPQETDELTAFIGEIRKRFGLTIFLIEHHMNLVMDISERIYVLDFGKLIAQGTPAEIQNNKRVIDAYLGVSEDA